jgi:hypothetical protein
MSRFLQFAILAISILFTACASPLKISTQKQFDDAVSRINQGEEMHFELSKGTYVLKQSLKATAPLSIKGNNATITSANEPFRPNDAVKATLTHNVYSFVNALSIFPLFYDKNGRILPISESVIDSVRVNYVEGEIIAPEEYNPGTAIKIPISSNLMHLKNKRFSKAFGYLDSGWKVVDFSVERADDKYFYCTTINDCHTKNFQYDKTAYKKSVRFVIFNVEIKEGGIFYDDHWLYVPKGFGDVYCVNRQDDEYQIPSITTTSDLILEGLTFCAIGGIEVNSDIKESCRIEKCTFNNCLEGALKVKKENGDDVTPIRIANCTFKDCAILSGNIVSLSSSFKGLSCIYMTGCELTRHSDNRVIYKNGSGGLYVDGDVTLTDNIVYNTCRAHLYLFRGNIIAKKNMLFNADEFNSQPERNFSSDWGLVYCGFIYTDAQQALNNKEHCALLEGNLLYGAFAYGGDARGIFIDDGRGDVICKNNVILNTQIYSIDSRNSRITEAASVRNRYERNIMTSNYRMAAGAVVVGDDVPSMSGNIMLGSKHNITANVIIEEEDKRLDVNTTASCESERIEVSKELYKVIKKSPAWKGVKKHVKQK